MLTLSDVVAILLAVALFVALVAVVHFSGIMRPGSALF
jgi:hypothetical protein